MNSERKCLAFLLNLILLVCAVGFFLYQVMPGFFGCVFGIAYIGVSIFIDDTQDL
jgi:hypothetical protein